VGIGAVFAIWPERRRVLAVASAPAAAAPVGGRVRRSEPVPEAAAPSVQVEEA
jgi:hypothetical protein